MEKYSKIGLGVSALGLLITLGLGYSTSRRAWRQHQEYLKQLEDIKRSKEVFQLPINKNQSATIDVQNEATNSIDTWRFDRDQLGSGDKTFYYGKLFVNDVPLMPDNEMLKEYTDTPIGKFQWSPRKKCQCDYGWIKVGEQSERPIGGLYEDDQFVEVGYVCEQGKTFCYYDMDELICGCGATPPGVEPACEGDSCGIPQYEEPPNVLPESSVFEIQQYGQEAIPDDYRVVQSVIIPSGYDD